LTSFGDNYKIQGYNVFEATLAGLVSGTVSDRTGGSFANGFVSGFYQNIFNNQGERRDAQKGGSAGSGTETDREAFQEKLNALTADGSLSKSRSFDSADAAATEVLNLTAPLSKRYGLEVGGNIWQDKDGWHYTIPVIGTEISVGVTGGYIGYHTHTSGGLKFSNAFWPRAGASSHDAGMVGDYGKPLYLGVHYKGATLIGVCEPGRCSETGRLGTSPSRTLQ
jgi:hypothetical protein